MKEGELWWFDNDRMHEAFNDGDQDRIHMIFDLLPRDRAEEVFGKAAMSRRSRSMRHVVHRPAQPGQQSTGQAGCSVYRLLRFTVTSVVAPCPHAVSTSSRSFKWDDVAASMSRTPGLFKSAFARAMRARLSGLEFRAACKQN